MRKSKKFLSLVLAFILIAGFMPTVGHAKEKVKLTILGTSDIHANIYGYSYEDDKETTKDGAARIYTYVEKVRAAEENVILVDDGDTYQGTILADAVYNKRDDMHPVSKFLNFIKYDAFTLGNHEFNFGIDFMKKFISELEMPTLGANVRYKDGNELAKPYAVVERSGVRVGILGLTNPNAPRWDGDKVEMLEFDGLEETAKRYVPILRNDENCDVVIVVAHAGAEPEFDEDNGSDGMNNVIRNVEGIDAVMLGHYHTANAYKENDIPVGSPRNAGRDVVRFDLDLEKENGKWIVKDSKVETVDMENYEPSKEVRELIAKEHQTTLDFIKGEGSEDGNEAGGGIFGTATADFQPVNEIKGLPEGKLRDTAVIDLIGKVQLEVSGADVTAVALFKNTSNIKKGNINYGTLFDIYKFDNTLYNVKVTGKELKDYMEWSVEAYNTWKPGDLNISFDEEIPGYRYDMFKGVDYKIDLSQDVGNRIKDVKFKGEELKDDQVLTLAVNNYRYSSGLKANKLIAGTRDWDSPMAIREYIAEYIKQKGEISPEVSNNWEIVGIDLEHELRDEIIELVNEGLIESPYHKALNIKDLEAQGIIVDGKVVRPDAKPEATEEVKEDSDDNFWFFMVPLSN